MAAPTNAAKREKSSCQLGAVHTWHFSDMAPQSPHVRFQGQLGKHLLALKDGHRYRSSVLFWADASAIGCSDYCLRNFPLVIGSRVAI